MNLYDEHKEERPLQMVNDCTFLELDKNSYDSSNFYASIIIYGIDDFGFIDHGVTQTRRVKNIKHIISISIEAMENGKIKIPSTISVAIKKLNGQDRSNILYINQVCKRVSVRTGNSTVWDQTELHSSNTDEIMEIITSYLDGYDELKDNINLQKGLNRILPELRTKITSLLNRWDTFDIDGYIEMLKREKQNILIKGTSMLDTGNAIASIQQLIDKLQQIRDDKAKS